MSLIASGASFHFVCRHRSLKAQAAQALAALHAVQQDLQHRRRGLADRNHEDPLVLSEIDDFWLAARP